MFDPIHPTELFHERQEAVMRDARLARRLRSSAVHRQARGLGLAYRGRTDSQESTFYQLL